MLGPKPKLLTHEAEDERWHGRVRGSNEGKVLRPGPGDSPQDSLRMSSDRPLHMVTTEPVDFAEDTELRQFRDVERRIKREAQSKGKRDSNVSGT